MDVKIVFLISIALVCCHGNENDINKYQLTEEKILQSISNLREHVLTLESHVAYIKRKTKHSYEALQRLEEAATHGLVGCIETDEEVSSSSKKKHRHCPSDFSLHRQGSCYMIESEKVTWEEARDQCQTKRAHLVAIETESEQMYLLEHINKNKDIQHCDFWAGGTDKNTEGQWVWEHSAAPLDYNNWHAKEPNNGSGREHCLWLDWYFGWAWNDATCDVQKACYICEKD